LAPIWVRRTVPADARLWLDAVFEQADRESDSVPPALRALALIWGGAIALQQRDPVRSRKLLETSVALWRAIDDQIGLATALGGLGYCKAQLRQFEEAESALTESLDLARRSGSIFVLCLTLNLFGNLARARGQLERATTFSRESVELGRTLEHGGERGNILGRSLVHLGYVLSEQGHVDEAMATMKEGLAELRDSGMTGFALAQALEWTAPLVAATGDSLRAARLFGAADSAWRASGVTRYSLDDQAYAREVQAVRDQLDDDMFEEAIAEGQAMTAAQAISHALGET
jgi:tetratricopeptide (TPR) repeat protein